MLFPFCPVFISGQAYRQHAAQDPIAEGSFNAAPLSGLANRTSRLVAPPDSCSDMWGSRNHGSPAVEGDQSDTGPNWHANILVQISASALLVPFRGSSHNVIPALARLSAHHFSFHR